MRAKLQSQKGLSLTEVLVAVAILAVLGAGVAFMLPASVQTFRDVTTGAEASVLCSTLSEAVAEELRFATNIGGEATDPVYDSQRFGTGVRMAVNDKGIIEIQKKSGDGAFETLRPLISEQVYTNKTYVDDFSYTLSGNIFTVSLHVKSAQTEQFSQSNFSVTALNVSSDGVV